VGSHRAVGATGGSGSGWPLARALRGGNERCFKVILVDIERLLVRVCFMQPKWHKRVDHFLHERLVDVFAIPMLLFQSQNSTSQFVVLVTDMVEKILLLLY
jgi:hypothetical protein